MAFVFYTDNEISRYLGGAAPRDLALGLENTRYFCLRGTGHEMGTEDTINKQTLLRPDLTEAVCAAQSRAEGAEGRWVVHEPEKSGLQQGLQPHCTELLGGPEEVVRVVANLGCRSVNSGGSEKIRAFFFGFVHRTCTGN
jgi:hypothetical protein